MAWPCIVTLKKLYLKYEVTSRPANQYDLVVFCTIFQNTTVRFISIKYDFRTHFLIFFPSLSFPFRTFISCAFSIVLCMRAFSVRSMWNVITRAHFAASGTVVTSCPPRASGRHVLRSRYLLCAGFRALGAASRCKLPQRANFVFLVLHDDQHTSTNSQFCKEIYTRKSVNMASKSSTMVSKKQPKFRKQFYKPEYSTKWDFIIQSSKANFVRCTLCGSDFSKAHSGAYDIEHHIKSAKHKSSAEDLKNQQSILQCFAKPSSANYDVIKAETLWTEYIVEHNMPFSASDDFTDVVKKMFPDSKIAAQFSCRRTKTTSIARTLGHDT